jgi:hypothetical protein
VGGEYGGNVMYVNAHIHNIIYVNGKLRPVETIPRMGGGEKKENDGGDEFNYGIL